MAIDSRSPLAAAPIYGLSGLKLEEILTERVKECLLSHFKELSDALNLNKDQQIILKDKIIGQLDFYNTEWGEFNSSGACYKSMRAFVVTLNLACSFPSHAGWNVKALDSKFGVVGKLTISHFLAQQIDWNSIKPLKIGSSPFTEPTKALATATPAAPIFHELPTTHIESNKIELTDHAFSF